MMDSSLSYEKRLSAERAIFENQVDVHDLPEIHHYWTNRHIRPKLETYGFSTPTDLFYQTLRRQFSRASGPLRFLSLGAGNCDLEVGLAARLRESVELPFTIECVDLNPAMLARGRARGQLAGASGNLEFTMADLNNWEPLHQYDAVIANQSLHHIVELEHLFAAVQRGLLPGAPFVVSDMIGRNGHRRWPEAHVLVNEFWRRLPPSYRFNRVLNRFEESFADWDCSVEGFEGSRAQDILPLLIRSFHFEFFFGFANVIEPFVDRTFGHNFDTSQPWVYRFIDEVHYRDETEQLAGKITPAHMLAIVTGEPTTKTGRVYCPLAPQDCVRDPDRPPVESTNAETECGYDSADWPYAVPGELTTLTRAFLAGQQKITALTRWGESLDREMIERTAWALELDRRVRELDGQARERELELARNRERIVSLQTEVAERTAWARALETEWNQRTQWALSLRDQLMTERKAAAELVYLRPGIRRVYQIARAIWRRGGSRR